MTVMESAGIAGARRAVAADRHAAASADSLAVEWRALSQLEPIVDAWRELAAHAVEPNVFYEPAFALAAAAVFGRDAGVMLIWSGESPRKLLGFFPARIEARRYGLKLPVLVGWTHPYGPLGTPLIAREAVDPVITAWLAHLAGDPKLPGLLLLPFVPDDSAFAAALGAIVRRTRLPSADFNRHRRALLAPTGERTHYVEQSLGARKLKELRRVGRRLSDRGDVEFTAATELPAVAAALDDFLALEAGGWKGKAGTAAAHHGDTSRFIRAALSGLAAEDKVAIKRILVDGRPIAATITLRSADAAWLWKIAYDEDFSRYSPGVMLTVAVTEELVDDVTLARSDSCATADHPMIDHIWRERLTLSDRLIAVRAQAPFASARRLEMLRAAAVTAAKSIRERFRRQRTSTRHGPMP